jgi:predicted DNA-binding transcriptional regulator AlpA
MREELVTTAEAREFLKVSRAKFCRLQKRMCFPRPVRLGRRCLRWRVAELHAFARAAQGNGTRTPEYRVGVVRPPEAARGRF